MLPVLRANRKSKTTLLQDTIDTLVIYLEAAKIWFKARYDAAVRSDLDRCVLQQYGNDATPIKTKSFACQATPEGSRRSGYALDELLIQFVCIRLFMGGILRTFVRVTDPLPLSHGKKCDAIFSAGLDFFDSLRSQGHRGIAIEAKMFDRGTLESPGHRFRQYDFKSLSEHARLEFSDMFRLFLLEWNLLVPCALHDIQNGIK